MTTEVLFSDNHLIVINKPFCMPSQSDETGDLSVFDWVKQWVKEKYNKPGEVYLALLHRLDRPAGGLMVLAKTSKAAERMSQQFKDRKIEKTYWAITENVPQPAEGRLEHHLLKLAGKNIMKAFNKPKKGAKEAILYYKVLETKNKNALVEVKLETGRQHQIRVQLARITCVIRGDLKYGAPAPNPDKSICLFSQKLAFEHPVTKEWLEFTATPPQVAWWEL